MYWRRSLIFAKPVIYHYFPASFFQTLKAFLPSMIENNKGHIVSISSVLGLMGVSGAADYVSSKYSSTGLSEALLDELKSQRKNGVKVTSVHPYHINNAMFEGLETR